MEHDCGTLRACLREGRVRPAPNIHSKRTHFIDASIVAQVFVGCFRVVRDSRTDISGEPSHPDGWIMWGRRQDRRTFRVDFNFVHAESGDFIEIVTVIEVADR